jgi:hypothetical protein
MFFNVFAVMEGLVADMYGIRGIWCPQKHESSYYTTEYLPLNLTRMARVELTRVDIKRVERNIDTFQNNGRDFSDYGT